MELLELVAFAITGVSGSKLQNNVWIDSNGLLVASFATQLWDYERMNAKMHSDVAL